MTIGSSDPARSRAFYDTSFGVIGGQAGREDAKDRPMYVHDGAIFLVTSPIDGGAATHADGGTIGFVHRMPPA